MNIVPDLILLSAARRRYTTLALDLLLVPWQKLMSNGYPVKLASVHVRIIIQGRKTQPRFLHVSTFLSCRKLAEDAKANQIFCP